MPNRKTWASIVSDQVSQRSIIAFEATPLLEHGLEIFTQHRDILHGSFTTAPIMLAASVAGVSLPSLKKVAWLIPPTITAIASAV
jgi:hypothetical protein